ncbi:MAG: dipeptide ABC transporter ATP-binding protein [Rhodobacteraceae bacterium]|nr:dipeptide ABC transporter ATP-binding protein [Paracoccaceae bacterium]
MPLLSVENLSLAFGSHAALRGLSFAVAAGETVALVGESGSGKSATALALMRLIERDGGQITGGRIRLADTDLTAASEAQMRRIRGNRIAMVFQEPMTALNPVMPLGAQVAEVLRLHRGLDGAAAHAAVLEAFARVRIPQPELRYGQFAHELSGGLRQRVMIAMALACQPDLLIADEPTTALDVTTQAGILSLIKSLQDETGMAVLFITHDMGVVAEIADRVVVLRAGEKMEEAPVARIFAAPQADYTRMLMAATPRLGSGAPAAPRPSDPVLEVENLSVRFALPGATPFAAGSEFHAVRDVSFSVGRGETLGLVGESGCGKSTLARACLRLIGVDQGEVRLCGDPLTGLSAAQMRPLRRRAQMVFQDPYASLNPRLTVADLITEPALIHGTVTRAGQRDLAAELLEKVGLEAAALTRFAHQFSGGQRQRLCIARALSVRPALIVADESVSALDVSVAKAITDLLARLQAEDGLSFLFISHDIAVVERVSHRIAVMQAGRIVEIGPTDRVLAAPAHPYTRRLLAAVPVPDPARRGPMTAMPDLTPPPPAILPRGARPRREALMAVGPRHFALASNDPAPLPPRGGPVPGHADSVARDTAVQPAGAE